VKMEHGRDCTSLVECEAFYFPLLEAQCIYVTWKPSGEAKLFAYDVAVMWRRTLRANPPAPAPVAEGRGRLRAQAKTGILNERVPLSLFYLHLKKRNPHGDLRVLPIDPKKV
jgi:hypothetical protein